jgi:hypothetical protein
LGSVNQLVNGTNTLKLNSDGSVQFPNYKFPAAAGTAGQVLSTDGSGNVSWSNASSSGITVSATPPNSPSTGSLWWDDVGGNLYIYYNNNWVAAQASPVISATQIDTVLGYVPTSQSDAFIAAIIMG